MQEEDAEVTAVRCRLPYQKHFSDAASDAVAMDKSPGLRWPDLLCAVSVLLLLLSLRARDDALRRLEEARRSVNITTGGGGDPRLVRQDVLVFNRVPKVGSVTVMNLVGLLRERNGFDAFTSLDGMPVQEGQVSCIFIVAVVLQRFFAAESL